MRCDCSGVKRVEERTRRVQHWDGLLLEFQGRLGLKKGFS